MGINPTTYGLPATRGDVAGLAINVKIALNQINMALLSLSQGDSEEALKQIAKISEAAETIDKIFDRLTGWTP